QFDSRRVVILPKEAQAKFGSTNGTELTVVNSNITAHRIEAEVAAKQAGIVVFEQSFYPAWQASVDGSPANVLLANSAFQAVAVPAGRHQIRLVYRDKSFVLGGKISAGAGLLCLLLLFVRGRPSK